MENSKEKILRCLKCKGYIKREIMRGVKSEFSIVTDVCSCWNIVEVNSPRDRIKVHLLN